MRRLILMAACLTAACSGGANPVAPGRDLSIEVVCPSCGVGRYTIRVGGLAALQVHATSLTTGEAVACGGATWSSDAVNVATVVGTAASATVRGLSPGDARIRVELDCGEYGVTIVETEFLILGDEPPT